MSNKNPNSNSRHTNTPSPSPSSPSLGHAPSKLPKFLQNKATRDRSKSVTDPGPAGSSPTASSIASSSGSMSMSVSPESIPSKPRKTSKFLSINKDKDKRLPETPPMSNSVNVSMSMEMDEPPVIVEPVSPVNIPSPIPRPRTRSERPIIVASSAPTESLPALYSSASSTSRIGDLPTRLSGWFAHTFSSSSTTDLSLPSLLSQQGASSPSGKGKGAAALLNAAKHGKGHLDKAMRYLLDSDATPDRCTDPIWLLGVRHVGWEEPVPSLVPVNSGGMVGGKTGAGGRKSSASSSFRSSTSSIISDHSTSNYKHPNPNSNSNSTPKDPKDPSANWPPVFYIDFTSRIWLTYRSQFGTPIRDGRLGDLTSPCSASYPSSSPTGFSGKENMAEMGVIQASSPTTMTPSIKRAWNWGGGEKMWTSDSGWGCMLRTGQSLLANALVCVHLGRDWRRPPHPLPTADYATYVKILTWFLDTPAPEAPFSVHRMALAGKELGTDVGQWFGPSVAAGGIRTLVQAFPECGLAVSVATDGTLYQSQVFAASHGEGTSRSPRKRQTTTWGDRPVLLLLGIRLGIEGVNPIYYDTIKLLYTFPQSVGIAGGRPSSSYYFVGSQADNLFYLDPHNARPAIPLRPVPPISDTPERQPTPDSDREHGQSKQQRSSTPNSTIHPQQQQHRTPASPSSVRTGSSNVSSSSSHHHHHEHAPMSPSPLQHQFSTSTSHSTSNTSNYSSTDGDSYSSSASGYSGYTNDREGERGYSRSPPPSYGQHSQHGRWRSASASSPYNNSNMDIQELTGTGGTTPRGNQAATHGLDPIQQHYCTAYSATELKTFHCERVRKMPLSGLDPSMLIGFLCRDEKDWWDFRRRVGELPRTIFSVQDEPPTWTSDSDDNMGFESISEPDDLDLDDDDDVGVVLGRNVDGEDDGEGDDDGEQFFDTYAGSSASVSGSSASHHNQAYEHDRRQRQQRGKSEEIDTEDSEDPVDPVTPGPNSRFIIDRPPPPSRKNEGVDEEDEEELDFRPDAADGETFGEEEGDDDTGDIEDDWIDPSVPTPTPAGPLLPPPPPRKDKHKSKDDSPSPPSSSNVPPLVKSKSSSSSTAKLASGSGSGSGKAKKTKKQVPVPVPAVKLPYPPQQQQQEHYPFPVTPIEEPSSSSPHDRPRNSSTKGKRMHTARARDGGRTQSGGVKGILTD